MDPTRLPVNIEDQMRESYMDYAMSVIIGRALPDARDGLKPVHRRILYAMFREGLLHNRRYSKCAGVVGEVLKRYHPHGDSAVYDALVRLAQEWNVRYTLIDGQGNFGSIDGDPPAAYRYTECRLTALAEELLADIDRETVEFVPNFDDSSQEPFVLPTRIPNLLVNGSAGIAVGMATNIPPHNLSEVCDGLIALIENPALTIDELMQYIPGPDFPTAGFICGQAPIRDAYREGRGILTLRARATVETDEKTGRSAIIVTEIPYQVNKSRLIERIAELVNERKLDGISDLRDESDREGMRIVIEVKRGELPEIILNNLYKHTQLQVSFGIIMLAIVDKQPKTLGLVDMMKYFIAHRKEVILRRTRFELRKAEERAHILEGLVICLDNLDAVIKLIRGSKTVDEARRGLMEKFGLTQVQAQAVLELQLQRLSQLERLKIQEEYAALKKRITDLRRILKDERLVYAIIVQELKEVKEEYGDERRTEIRDEAVSELRPEDLVKEEDVAIVYTSSGYIKRTSLTSYKFQARGGKGRRGIEMKAEDIVEDLYVCSTHSYLLVFTNQGRLYWLKALDVPDVGVSGRGKPIANLVEFQPGEKPASVVPVKEFSENQYVVMLTTDGVIKKTRLSDFRNVRRGGILAMNIRPKSELFSAQLSTGKNTIVIGTRLGRALQFKESDVRPMGRSASGVRGIRLKPKDRVIGMIIVGPDEKFIFTASERGYGKKTAAEMYPIKHRGGQGVLNLRITPKIGHALAMVGINEEDLLVITVEGKVIGIPTTQVRSSGRATQGVRIINLEDRDRVCSIAKVRES
ncbi:MAG TPA: DNA gyrase subunit A [Terriglobales bacterium]|nr:DNA gyrase subunit A [Terriglobales bacterium]